MSAIIAGSNKKKLETAGVNKERTIPSKFRKYKTNDCECQKYKRVCPVNGKCKKECVVYRAKVKTEQDEKEYVGCTEGCFLQRWQGHQTNFRHRKYINDTELSGYIWNLIDKELPYSISWEILDKVPPLKRNSKYCNLCTTEKWRILLTEKKNVLTN